MIAKTIIQGLLTILLFLACWWGLSKFPWDQWLGQSDSKNALEEKLGEQLWRLYSYNGQELKDEFIVDTVDSLVNALCEANDLPRENFKIHIVDKSEVNAFALPDGHLIINSGLINQVTDHRQLAGVIGHEMGHITQKHVMHRLVREMGLAILVSASTGNSGGMIHDILRHLSSTSFDRDEEREADSQSAQYLDAAGINPIHLADFMYMLSTLNSDMPDALYWISTHPDSQERANNILEEYEDWDKVDQSIIQEETWEKLQSVMP
ncbi:hypothetical protein GCM10007049_11410 [Echinicola pacifica]|uniref:Peptidase M48 domain-containing protein n=1 Tax=Echinicola pacifica TaxID=346377 RepID=A0A918PRT7_9BACT|nr:M48 family metallopeptidase [Echinicola pacifica]GGZ20551.1 hypothetical protein GCM10007049_11410 [Echinicola pacifica]